MNFLTNAKKFEFNKQRFLKTEYKYIKLHSLLFTFHFDYISSNVDIIALITQQSVEMKRKYINKTSILSFSPNLFHLPHLILL